MTKTEKIGLGCSVLFLLPFCGVGVVAAVVAVRFALASDWLPAGMALIFALIFGGVGFGLLVVVLTGRRRVREAERLRAQSPDEPWLWRPDWTAGRIEGSSRRRMAAAWSFTVFWNLIAFTVPFFVLPQALRDGEKFALFTLIFPAIGLVLLAWAVRLTLHYRKYGTSVLRLATVPGVIGHLLRGVIVAKAWIRPEGGFRLTLSCVNRVVSGSGNNRSTREKVLWQDEQRVEQTQHVGRATAIPVSFRLPDDARESDDSDPRNRIIWRLEASASVPGVDYRAGFELPVFRTAESDVPLTDEEERSLAEADEEPRQPPDSRIRVRESLRRTEVYFPAARNIGFAIGLTVFFALWTGVIFMLVKLGAPLLFPVVFGLFDLLIGYGTLAAWTRTTHVVAAPEGIRVRNGLLGLGRTRLVPAADIDDITLDIGMQAGNRPYYDIRIRRRGGKKLYAGRAIRDKREAEWLIGRLRAGLGTGD